MRRVDTILAKARKAADNEDVGISEGIPQDTLADWINDAQDRAQALVSAAYAEFLQTAYAFNTVVGQEDYEVVGSRLFLNNRVSLVEFSPTGLDKDFRPLKKASIFNSDQTQGQPTRYIRRNNVIKLNPIPNSTSYRVRIHFEREANDLDFRRARIMMANGPIAEVTPVTCVNDASVAEVSRVNKSAPGNFTSSGASDYFLLSSTLVDYYVWFERGTSVDPVVSGRTGVKVDITAAASANDVKDEIDDEINLLSDFSSTTDPDGVIITCGELGNTADIADGTYPLTPTLPRTSTVTPGVGSDFIPRLRADGNGSYFTISSPLNAYYVWMNLDGAGVDPAVPGRFGIEVALLLSDTPTDAATKIAAAIDAESDFSATSVTDTVTVTNTITGPVSPDADVGTALTSISIGSITQGTEITSFDLESTLPVPDPEIDNIDVGDYACVVDKDGNICIDNIPITAGDVTAETITVDSYVLEAGESVVPGDYIVLGRDTTTHSELPDAFEAYLRLFVVWKILEKDGSTEFSRRYENHVTDEEKRLVGIYSSLGEELVEIPVLGEDFEEEYL